MAESLEASEYILRNNLLYRMGDAMCEVLEQDFTDFDEAVKAVEKAMVKCVHTAKAADVAPVRHGRWDYSRSLAGGEPISKCSNCMMEFFSKSSTVISGRYCPNCGAKMDLEDIDGGYEK